MKTLGDVLKSATQFLKERQDERARHHAEHLMSYVLKLPRLDLYMQFDRPLQENELSAYRELFKRKAKGEPLEYIIGEIEFYGCLLKVTPDVLIPRPETEILLDKICTEMRLKSAHGMEVWDLCTGSGCLGIGLKKTFPELHVTLSDLSQGALEIARCNAQSNGTAVELVQGDLLVPFHGRKADLIVCNPPYISQKEFTGLDPSVSQFEPTLALIGGEDGLCFYERLAVELPAYLNPGARVYLEIGCAQGAAVEALFSSSCWRVKSLQKDWAGHDRFFFLEFE